MKEIIESSNAPPPIGPYSQAVADAGLLFMSGQVGRQHNVATLEPGVAEQTRQAIRNLQAVLAERGLALADVVKTTVFLLDMDDFGAMNAVYIEMFGEDASEWRGCRWTRWSRLMPSPCCGRWTPPTVRSPGCCSLAWRSPQAARW